MKKRQNKGFYNRISWLLSRTPLRVFTNVFSHGATHFAFFIVVGVITAYLWRSNNQENIKPHNIGIHIGWSSSQARELQEFVRGYLPKDSIDSVRIHIRLNSQYIHDQTAGKYRNGIEVDFIGKSRATTIVNKKKDQVYDYLDSIVLSLYSHPSLETYDVAVEFIPYQNNNIEYVDSIGEDDVLYRTFLTHKLLYSDGSPVNSQLHYRVNRGLDDVVDISFSPAAYKQYTGQETVNCVHIYSDDIGVEENSPYYYYYINIPPAPNAEIQSIDLQVADIVEKDRYSMKYVQGKNLQYYYIHPEPDIIGNGRIVYTSNDKKEAIKNNEGIIIQAVDIDALNRQNRDTFLYSVLVGTGLAFLLDIFIQLIRELRRLQRKK